MTFFLFPFSLFRTLHFIGVCVFLFCSSHFIFTSAGLFEPDHVPVCMRILELLKYDFFLSQMNAIYCAQFDKSFIYVMVVQTINIKKSNNKREEKK